MPGDNPVFRLKRTGFKDEPPAKILEAIEMITTGGAPMSPGIAAKTLHLLRNAPAIDTQSTTETFDLTKREIQILEQISQGLAHPQIAENLFISPATVRKHIENIYSKLQVNNKIRAVKKAIKHRLI